MTREELLDALRAIDPGVTVDPEAPPPDEQSGMFFAQSTRVGFKFVDYYRDASGVCVCPDEQLDSLRDWLSAPEDCAPGEGEDD